MPSKKKKYNARFPAGRIKKIMQSDEEIGKVAQAVPVIISRTLELFVESLLTKTLKITNSRNAKTLSTSHMKQCIMSEQRFDFLRELVKTIPDISVAEEAANYNEDDAQSSPEEQYHDSDTPHDLSMPSTSTQASRSNTATTNGAGNIYHRSYSENIAASAGSTASIIDKQNRLHLKRDIDGWHRVANAANSSVIMHTTSVLNAHTNALPAKLSRSDSAPANALIGTTITSSSSSSSSSSRSPTTQSHNQYKFRTRQLKYQAQSAPCGNGPTAKSQRHENVQQPAPLPPQTLSLPLPLPPAATATPTPTATPPAHQQAHQTPTAIPAPIVSFDFCNKPIVKIDYSNLPLSTPEPAAPHSDATNFSGAPVINIDLSNIVTSPTTTELASPKGGAALAAIGIAAPSPTTTTNTSHISSSSPKASVAVPSSNTSSKSVKLEMTTTTTTLSKNSFFELDEDYDNI